MDDDRRCTATSKRTGERCRRAAAVGQRTCAMHGAKSPQARKAARERLAAAADPAAGRLAKLVRSTDETVALRASVAVLDRTGHGRTSGVEISGPVIDVAGQIAAFTRGLLEDLGVDLDDPHTRTVIRSHMRAMSLAHDEENARALRAVPDAR